MDERLEVQVERLGSETAEFPAFQQVRGFETAQEPEFAHVPETKLMGPAPERNDEMSMLVARSLARRPKQPSGHLEMENQIEATLAFDEDHLSPTPDGLDPFPSDPLKAQGPILSQQGRKKNLDILNDQPGQLGTKAGDNGFDFRELGHGAIVPEIRPLLPRHPSLILRQKALNGIPKLTIGANYQLKAQSIPLNRMGATTPDGWRGSGAPRRPERLMPLTFCLGISTIDREGAGGEPRQDPSGVSIGNFGWNYSA
jgi:hypothetical protein